MSAILDLAVPTTSWHSEAAGRNGDSPPSLQPPRGWQSTIGQLQSFHEIANDWDGSGAIAPPHELLVSAIGLAYLLGGRGVTPPQRVVPGLEGSVILEWQFPDGGYGEIEVIRPFSAEVMLMEPGKPARHWTLPTD